MKGDIYNNTLPSLQPQDNCPPKKANRRDSEISLETLEILLTSVPDEESIVDCSQTPKNSKPTSQLSNIQNIISHKKHFLKRLEHLKKRKRGAEWLYKNLSYFQTHFPWELISLLENMAHEKSPDIICKTLNPINTLCEQKHTTNTYHEHHIGKLEGLEVLTTNIRRLIYNSLETPLQKISTLSLEQLDNQEINVWNDWCINIESHFQRAEEMLLAGQRFFSLQNFQLMERLPISKRSLIALQVITKKSSPSENT